MKELQTLISLYKNEGETPLQALDRFRVENPEYKEAVLSYAGRLDPMAEGLLLVLVNEENKNREKYLGLDKTYEVEILFGVSTDTGDVLGKPAEILFLKDLSDCRRRSEFLAKNYACPEKRISPQVFQDTTKSFKGPFKQKYPHYSSKTVNGKPLFQWAREGRLNEIEIPEKEGVIYEIKLLEEYSLSGKEILEKIKERIAKVSGDFRQEEIISSWNKALVDSQEKDFQIIKIEVRCSSGVYMRTLAEKLAERLGTRGLAWRINRVAFSLI